jgi:F-type H+-transporting ATPase subunit b
MFSDPTFWVAVAFVAFVGVAIYYKAPGMLTKLLDERAEKIRNDLEEARRLREEAEKLFADYEARSNAAKQEAEGIIAQARATAEREAKAAEVALAQTLDRRVKAAQAKIAQAETQAVVEVRRAAVEVAIAAARKVVSESLSPADAGRLIDRSIGDLGRQIN